MEGKPTEYFIYDKNGVWHRKSKAAGNNLAYKELYRNTKYIVIVGKHKHEELTNTLKWKIPLHGGKTKVQVNSSGWRDVGVLSREN